MTRLLYRLLAHCQTEWATMRANAQLIAAAWRGDNHDKEQH